MNKYSPYVLYLLISILVVVLYISDFTPLASMQQSINDGLVNLTTPDGTRPNMALINIGKRAQDEFGPWPWSRDRVADLLAATASGEPRAIVLDVDLSEDAVQDSAGYTSILAGQMKWIDNVVLPYDIALASFRSKNTAMPEHLFKQSLSIDNPLGLMDESSSLLTRKVFLPAEKLLADDPHLGFSYSMPDHDRILRHEPLAMNYLGYYYPSVSLKAASVYLKLSPDHITIIENNEIQLGTQRSVPIDRATQMYVRYYPAESFEIFSAADILGDDFDYGRLKNRMVIIGVETDDPDDTYSTSLNPETSRLIARACAIENIVNGQLLQVTASRSPIYMMIMFALGAVCAFVMPQVNMKKRLLFLAVGVLVAMAAQVYLVAIAMVLPQTIYFLLELILFMAAAPFLRAMLESDEGYNSSAASSPKASAKTKAGDAEVSVREIADDTGGQSTKIMETTPSQRLASNEQTEDESTTDRVTKDAPYDDFDAISLDGDEPENKKPAATESESKSDSVTIDPAIVPTSQEGLTADPNPNVVPCDTPSTLASGTSPTSRAPVTPIANTPVDASLGISNLGRYQVTGILGKGAMGKVYKGVDPAINRPVALKTIRLDFVNDPEEEAELKERLHREAQAAGKLSHPNIVTIYDVGSEGSLQYIAMEYLEGQTLEEMIKKKVKFNYRIIAQIIMQICAALQYAHEREIVHRDIKPANIMILKDYNVKVMDYGIARIESNSMTKTGIAMGTPNYISPEQLRGKNIDNRADIFSLGVLIYELVVGKRPFRGENITSLIYSVLNHTPEKPSNVVPQIPLLFDQILHKALDKDPDRRYQKASELMADMSEFVEAFSSKS
jgi:serine/threonine-protein kinase